MKGIYKITNIINKKIYIGQSINIEQRWKQHQTRPFQNRQNDKNNYLYKAIRKYGLNNFLFEVIEECDDLDSREIYWIKYYQSNNPSYGYNCTSGGQHSAPIKIIQETAKEIQFLLINTNLTQQQIANKFNVSQRLISYINNGELWLSKELSYPLRKNKNKLKNNKVIHPKARKCERPERETLKKEIREFSFVQLSKKYSVSDNAIKKWCDDYNLPRLKREINSYSDEDWLKI